MSSGKLTSVSHKCKECGAMITVPSDVAAGELFTCPDCGVEYEAKLSSGSITLQVANLEAEDWGE